MPNDRTEQKPNAPRKPYEKPSIIYREPLEAVASSCTTSPGKASPATCSYGSS